MYPYPNPSILSRGLSLIKNIKWGSLLDGTQKTLGVINQAIPIVYQAKPLVSSAKTLFKISNIINTPDQDENEKQIKKEPSSTNSPIFYI